MKVIKCVLIVCFLALVNTSLSENVYEFTDDTGERIALKHEPGNVAVLFSSYADMWLLSGGEISVTVGETIERGFAGRDTALVDSGAGKQVDIEKLGMAEVDFIIGSCDISAHIRARDSLRDTGVPFALFRVENMEDYLRVFEIMTQINRNENAYGIYGEAVAKEAEAIIERSGQYSLDHPQRILFVRSGSGYSSAKAKTADMHFAAKMLKELGAKNIAEDAYVLIDGLSFEEIYMKDPDAIFISLMGNEDASKAYMQSLLSKKEWQALTAVQNGRCYFLEKDLFQFKPNKKWAAAYEEMAKMLYPEWTEER